MSNSYFTKVKSSENAAHLYNDNTMLHNDDNVHNYVYSV